MNKTIYQVLFKNNIIMTFLLVFTTCIFFFITQYTESKKKTFGELDSVCENISISTSHYLEELNDVSVGILFSSLTQDVFLEYMENYDSDNLDIKDTEETLTNLLLPQHLYSDVRQINLYHLTGNGFGIGNYFGYINHDVNAKEWFQDVVNAKGYAYITYPSQDAFLSKRCGTDEERYYISLCRILYSKLHAPICITEVMSYYDVVFESAISPSTQYNISVYVYSNDGKLLFPVNREDELQYQEYVNTQEAVAFNGEEYIFTAIDPFSNTTTLVTVSKNYILFSNLSKLIPSFMILVCVLVISCFVANKSARQMSMPIEQLYQTLNENDGTKKWKKMTSSSKVYEINELYMAINEFQRRQQQASKNLLAYKESEAQAKVLALHSQMNPHFLYNSLAMIKAMAEEGLDEEIGELTMTLSEILRYISSDKKMTTTLEEELEHCSLYLYTLKFRYKDALYYDMLVEDELLDCEVPKLIIQLLIENSIKFMNKLAPPWEIRIEGTSDSNIFLISVIDNGPGFDEAILIELKKKIEEIQQSKKLNTLEINGMGLLNVYMRLFHQFGDRLIFEIGNIPSGGAIITFGSKLSI